MARVLIVADYSWMREFYAQELANLGHKVRCAKEVSGLPQTVYQFQAEVVVAGVSSWDFAQKVRNKFKEISEPPGLVLVAPEEVFGLVRTVEADAHLIGDPRVQGLGEIIDALARDRGGKTLNRLESEKD